MAGQAKEVCLGLLHSQLCCTGGVCRWLGPWVKVVLCTPVHATACLLAGECRGRASHPPGCVPAPLALCALCSWQEVRRTRWQVTPVCSPVLCRGLCPGACCHDGGEEACTTCALFPVGPSACWGQPLSKVTTKWQQLWHLLAPPGAQVEGMVASQRRGPAHPPVC